MLRGVRDRHHVTVGNERVMVTGARFSRKADGGIIYLSLIFSKN